MIPPKSRWTEPAPTGDSTEESPDGAGSYRCFRDKLRPYSVVRRQLLLAPRRAILELSASSQTIPRCPFPRVRKPADFKMVTGDDQRASGRCREIPRDQTTLDSWFAERLLDENRFSTNLNDAD